MDRWTTIRVCPHGEALVLLARLDAEGIPSRLRDENARTMDPFIVAPASFDAEVQVPATSADAAERMLADTSIALPVEESEAEQPAPALRALDALGRRIRWCACTTLFAPYGLWLGVRYLQRVAAEGAHPPGHAWNIAGIAFCATVILAFALLAAHSLA